ncbi:serine hydrolase [Arenicella chitinivorans]|uniref:Serine hydrolase n=1 Tax=Arenicella chitinivorans TaxID=1329800 RepID=A0A918RKY5_9GAMM|nr:serine hydrolase domain-containing protein [Arenicella chitinivorans]GHA00478.1 serine hydrolase [Arenicella chitinivorans]
MKSLLCHIALLVLLICSPFDAEATPPPVNLSDFLKEIDALRIQARIPGLSVAVVKDQQLLVAAGLGYTNLEQKILAAADTPYDIASVTKPISGVAAMQLVDAKQIDLDRPIAEYSDWRGFCEAFSQQPSIFAKDLSCEPATHTLRHLLTHTATQQPGTNFSYNPVLFSWASRPIMAVVEQSFSELVVQNVFTPTQMHQSARTHRERPLPQAMQRRLPSYYSLDNDGNAVLAAPGSPQGDGAAGGVHSTVVDLAKFDIALDRGELLSADARQVMFSPTPLKNGTLAPYGIGWFIEDYQDHLLAWHSGWWENRSSSLYIKVLDQDVSLIMLANSEGIWWHNALDKAEVARSAFAQVFFATFLSTE